MKLTAPNPEVKKLNEYYRYNSFLICSFREFTANELYGTIIVPEGFDLFG